MSDAGEIVGMVDVLKLTYATLDQVNSMSTGEGEGPAWQKFWLSMDNDTESQVSDGGSRMPRTPVTRSIMSGDQHLPHLDGGDAVMPNESASHRGAESPEVEAHGRLPSPTTEETPFAFKFKAPSGRVHRIQVTAAAGMSDFVNNVIGKLGSEVDAVGGEPVVENDQLGKSGFALSYLDVEGDTVSITTAQDLVEAIDMARKNGKDKVDMFVHSPEQAPIPPTVQPQPGLPQDTTTKEKRRRFLDGQDDEAADDEPLKANTSARQAVHQAEQVIAGVPNELLLPGAIGVLAVVIVAVFALGRSSSR